MESPARSWRSYPQRYRLEAAKCSGCGKVLFPPRLTCPNCHGREFTQATLPRDGRVVAPTVIHVPPQGFKEHAPYAIAVVELKNGVRVMVQVADMTDPRELAVGDPVHLEFRRIREDGEAGLIFYGHKAIRD